MLSTNYYSLYKALFTTPPRISPQFSHLKDKVSKLHLLNFNGIQQLCIRKTLSAMWNCCERHNHSFCFKKRFTSNSNIKVTSTQTYRILSRFILPFTLENTTGNEKQKIRENKTHNIYLEVIWYHFEQIFQRDSDNSYTCEIHSKFKIHGTYQRRKASGVFLPRRSAQ